MRPSLPLLAGLAAASLAWLAPAIARASACCGVGHSVGLRLTEAENAAFISTMRGAARIGSWASTRGFALPGEGDYDRQIRGEIGWLVRVKRRGEIGVLVPLVYTFRQAGELASSGGGVGDVTATGRFHITPAASPGWIPGISVSLGALIPTGRGADASEDVLASDATGLGAGELRPGITLEKAWGDGWLATAAFSAGWRTPFTTPAGISVKLAPRWQALAAVGPSWSWGFSLSLGVLYEREGSPEIDGIAAPDATRERTSAILFAAYDADDRWTLVASSQIDAPITGLGRNESAEAALSVGVRHTWGWKD
jgi:hypothetical protein